MKKILITGNSGYIGSHLSQILNKKNNYELYGIDIKNPVIDIANFQNCDITNILDTFTDITFDCVVHLAAKVSVPESVNNPKLYYKTNIFGTMNILENIKYKNFILASTGGAAHLENPYAISKKSAEDLVLSSCNNFTVFRFYNVIGFENIQPTNINGLFYNLVKAIETKNFNLYGNDYCTPDGTCIRDYIHVNEVCNSIIKAIHISSNSIENLGRGHGYSVLEITEIFKKVNNVDFNVTFCPKRKGDLTSDVVENKSVYMKVDYSIEEILKLK